jgi:hypothetical protein
MNITARFPRHALGLPPSELPRPQDRERGSEVVSVVENVMNLLRIDGHL